MKSNFKKLTILSFAAFSLFASRQALAMKQLDAHSMLIVSKYFNSMQDYANLEKTCKQYKDLHEEHHMNHIPLTVHELPLFPSIETYCIYDIDTASFIADSHQLPQLSYQKIVYKAGSFNYKIFEDIMNAAMNKEIKINGNAKDFNIVCRFNTIEQNGTQRERTIEFEMKPVIFSWPALNAALGSYEIDVAIRNYNYIIAWINEHQKDIKIEPIKKDDITEFIINDSTKHIGNHVFEFCKNLTTINIPDGVTSIGEQAFSCCGNLKSITIPSSVKSIGKEAFYCCRRLTEINIPNDVTSIGTNAFAYCNNLTKITYKGHTYKSVDEFLAAFNSLWDKLPACTIM